MSNVAITHEAAASRHGEQVQAICQELGGEPAAIGWSYDWSVRIDGNERGKTAKGMDVFIQNPGRYGICLVGKLGRKRRQQTLDSLALASNKASWPVEMFQVPKPAGPSIRVWQPRRLASPGWNEAIVVSAKEDPKSGQVELRAVTDENETKVFVRSGQAWKQSACGVSGKGWRDVDARAVVDTLDDGYMVAGEVSTGELLAALGADPSMAPEDNGQETAPQAGAGLAWDWGQSVDDARMGVYRQLTQSLKGPSSGNFGEVLAGLSNPANHAKREIADAVLVGIAMGREAMEVAREAIHAHAGLPDLPETQTDIAGFIEANLEQAPGVCVRPVFLGARRGIG